MLSQVKRGLDVRVDHGDGPGGRWAFILVFVVLCGLTRELIASASRTQR